MAVMLEVERAVTQKDYRWVVPLESGEDLGSDRVAMLNIDRFVM